MTKGQSWIVIGLLASICFLLDTDWSRWIFAVLVILSCYYGGQAKD
jgi:hypothetical protein